MPAGSIRFALLIPISARLACRVLACMILISTACVHDAAAQASSDEKQASEVWAGTLKAGAQEIKMQFRVFEEDGEGERSAKLDVISQGANGLPASVSVDGDKLTFEIQAIASKFEGDLNEARDEIDGHWFQNGLQLPLVMKKVEKAETQDDRWASRPQVPKAPFPYEIREVKFTNSDDDVTLAGTLTIPQAGSQHPSVILISGSGPQDRDESLLGHKPFAVIADHLSRNGVAVLRMDDRGVGKSTGSFDRATTEDFSRDVEAGVDFLLTIDSLDRNKIGLAGHSEGGLIAPIIAARRSDVAFIVLLAGPGIPGEQIVRLQSALIARAQGVPEAMIQLNRRFMDKAIEAVRNAGPQDDIGAKVDEAVGELIAELPDAQKAALEPARDQISAGLKVLTNPWFKYFMAYDPKPTLQKVECPVLAIIGEKDLQVPAKVNIEAIESALKAGGNKDYEVAELEGLNHLFQAAQTGSPTEYINIEETVSPRALEKISDWINARMQ